MRSVVGGFTWQSLCSDCFGGLRTVPVVSLIGGFQLWKSCREEPRKSRLRVAVSPVLHGPFSFFCFYPVCDALCRHSRTRLICRLRSLLAWGWRARRRDRFCGSRIEKVELGTGRSTIHCPCKLQRVLRRTAVQSWSSTRSVKVEPR